MEEIKHTGNPQHHDVVIDDSKYHKTEVKMEIKLERIKNITKEFCLRRCGKTPCQNVPKECYSLIQYENAQQVLDKALAEITRLKAERKEIKECIEERFPHVNKFGFFIKNG